MFIMHLKTEQFLLIFFFKFFFINMHLKNRKILIEMSGLVFIKDFFFLNACINVIILSMSVFKATF